MLPAGRRAGRPVSDLDTLAGAIWQGRASAALLNGWRRLAVAETAPPGTRIVRQLHPADSICLLVDGEVRHSLDLAGSREAIDIGSVHQNGFPLGWSGLVIPHRYATSAQAVTTCRLYRFPIAGLEALFGRYPRHGATFFSYVFAMMQPLLDTARSALNTAPLASSLLRDTYADVAAPGGDADPSPAACRALLEDSLFLDGLDPAWLDALAAHARPRRVAAGEILYREGDPTQRLTLLVSGLVEIRVRRDDGSDVVLRHYNAPGQVVAGSSFTALKTHRERALTVTDSLLLDIDRQVIADLGERDSRFALALERRWLWLLSARLRTLRLHLVAQQRGDEIVVVQDLLGQVSPQLGVDTALYKLPHLLANRVTHAEAFACLDGIRDAGTRLERTLAGVLGGLLAGLRREHGFYEGLNRVYRVVSEAPPEQSGAAVRHAGCIAFQQAFKHTRHIVRGHEHLPQRPGNIFILNHLVSYPGYALANGFEFAIDTHFVSSMILEPAYADCGVRVVRRGRGEEHGHHRYYDRLGHVYVLTAESDAIAEDAAAIAERRRRFTATCAAHLDAGSNLIVCPEGTSNRVDDSPSAFKKGTFHLAAALDPEPLVVPIAVVNIDRPLKDHRLGAVIQRPFRVSEVCDPGDKASLEAFLDDLRSDYRRWIADARALADAPD